jgi:hypothetical protein
MRIVKVLLLIFSLITTTFAVTLQNSTIVVIKTQDQLMANKLKTGQELTFLVAAPVVVNGKTLIEAGAVAFGQVQDAKSAQMAGIAGKLTVAIHSVTAVDGTTIQLSGQFISQGDSEVGATVAVGVILCPLALLNHGEQGSIPVGAQIRAFTIGTYEITPKD